MLVQDTTQRLSNSERDYYTESLVLLNHSLDLLNLLNHHSEKYPATETTILRLELRRLTDELEQELLLSDYMKEYGAFTTKYFN